MEDSTNKILQKPLDVIQELFNTHLKAQPKGEWMRDNWGVNSFFASFVNEHFDEIPILSTETIEKIPNGSLVRYRGMIQDMFDPEYYLGVFQQVNNLNGEKQILSGKYKDVIDSTDTFTIQYDSPSSVTLDRTPLFCVPIPGLANWCNPTSKIPTISPNGNSNGSNLKRKMKDEEEHNENDNNMETEARDSDSKRTKAETSQQNSTKANGNLENGKVLENINFPLPNSSGLSCLVKVYDNEEGSFKLNEVLDFVGILTITPQLSEFGNNPDDMEDGFTPVLPPSSLVPRLHCVTFRKVDYLSTFLSPTATPKDTMAKEECATVRRYLIQMISSVFSGDELIAEYLLLSMLSKVYKRTMNIALGTFSLNITNCPENAPMFRRQVEQMLNAVLPKSYWLPMTTDFLNKNQFIPKKDYDANRLLSGILQLSEGTFLVIDETCLQSGQLDTTGVMNLRALNELVIWQKVEYDFAYHKIDFPTDIPILILSVGKSMLKTDCRVAWKPQNEYNSNPPPVDAMELIQKFRVYLGLLRNVDYNIPDDVSKVMQEEFVNLRKADANAQQDIFHLWLTLARLHSISHGEKDQSVARWQEILQLEKLRTARYTK